jgi:hypothetical protein
MGKIYGGFDSMLENFWLFPHGLAPKIQAATHYSKRIHQRDDFTVQEESHRTSTHHGHRTKAYAAEAYRGNAV